MSKFFTPQRFLCKFSLHIGVVTICSMGIMLYIISFFINMFSRDPEWKDSLIMIHWFIVMIFILMGFCIYIIGMTAAYKESPRITTIALIFLIIHLVIWVLLTGLSFINNLTINRIVCIDNRCADRLFIKNGNWRRADEKYCNNPSRLRGVLLGDIDIREEEGPEASGQRPDETGEAAFVDYIYDHDRLPVIRFSSPGRAENGTQFCSDAKVIEWLKTVRTPSDLEKHNNLHSKSIIQRSNIKNRTFDIVVRGKRNVSFAHNSSAHGGYRYSAKLPRPVRKPKFRVKVFNESGTSEESHRSNDSNNLIQTPIGYVGCNAPQHIAFSAICALMILYQMLRYLVCKDRGLFYRTARNRLNRLRNSIYTLPRHFRIPSETVFSLPNVKKVMCTKPQFFVIYRRMLEGLWYIYPIIIFHSYSQRLKKRWSLGGY